MPLPPSLTSASHPLARQVRALARGVRERREEGLFLVEGPRGVEEALLARAPLAWVLVGSRHAERPAFARMVDRCLREGIPVQPVRDELLDRLLTAEHGAGAAATCRLPSDADVPETAVACTGAPLVVAWEVQNPGSLGALVRSAAAFGAGALIAAGGADPWNPKAVRASAGAVHRLRCARSGEAAAVGTLLEASGRRLVAAVARGGCPPEAVDWSADVVLLLGSEVSGLPPEIEGRAEPVTIPTTDEVESLSVPIAGSILLRQAFARRSR
jgi:RNA methyltransferase, TrmH family